MKEKIFDLLVVILCLIWLLTLGASFLGWLPSAVILILSICGVTEWAVFWIVLLCWALAIAITLLLSKIIAMRERK